MLVDDEDDGASLQSLEAEHVPVEHLVGVPQCIPVGGVAAGLAGGLLGMTAACRQQREILWPPTLFEKHLDLVVSDANGLVAAARDEGDRRPVPTEEPHRMSAKPNAPVCGTSKSNSKQSCNPRHL